MASIKTLWDFTRPHTIIGSFLSIAALYALAVALQGLPIQAAPGLFGLSLLAALACNVFITGLNQVADVAIDRINKPYLPIPSGRLSLGTGQRLVLGALILALGSAALLGWAFLGLIGLIAAVGAAYSLPPLRFKRHHLGAAFAITFVRGILVNLGFYLHFQSALGGGWALPAAVWTLALFVLGFSFGIAWFKDIPDTAGDAAHGIRTLALSLSKAQAFRAGVAVVSGVYLFVLWRAPLHWDGPALRFALLSHGLLLAAYWWASWRLRLDVPAAMWRYYMFFWGLFFVEYIVFPLAFFL